MSKAIEMDKMAESIASMVIEWVDGGTKMGTDWRTGLAGVIQLRLNRLAAPVVERQEPNSWKCFDGEGGYDYTDDEETAERWKIHLGDKYANWLTPLYVSPPAPVAVVLPPAQDVDDLWHSVMKDQAIGWNACLDKVKELNQ